MKDPLITDDAALASMKRGRHERKPLTPEPAKDTLSVALADDEPEILGFLERVVSHCGYRIVASAENGRELLEKCRAARPDLIITDVRMPEMTGLEAVAAFEAELPTPVILLSAQHAPEAHEAPHPEYVLSHLLKPFKRADIEAALRRAMTHICELRLHPRRTRTA